MTPIGGDDRPDGRKEPTAGAPTGQPTGDRPGTGRPHHGAFGGGEATPEQPGSGPRLPTSQRTKKDKTEDLVARFAPLASMAALGLSLIMLLYLFGLHSGVSSNQADIVSLQRKGEMAPDVTQVSDQVQALNAAVEDLARDMADIRRNQMGASDVREVVEAQAGKLADLTGTVKKIEKRLKEGKGTAARASQSPASRASGGVATATGDGDWVVHLMSVADPGSAAAMKAKLQAHGVDVDEATVTSGGRLLYRLSVSGFGSSAEAKAFGEQIKAKVGLEDDPWVARR